MAFNSCPNCELKLTRSECERGSCPTCGATLNTTAPPAARNAAQRTIRSRSAATTATGGVGVCELTGERRADLQRAYLRVAKATIGLAGSVRFSYVNIQVNCSRAALRRGKNIMWKSLAIALSWMILTIAGLCLIGLLGSMGAPRGLIAPVALAVFLPVPVLLLVSPILVGRCRRRWLNRLLPEKLNASLKQLSGCKDWSFRYNVEFLKSLPRNESALSSSMLPSLSGAGAMI